VEFFFYGGQTACANRFVQGVGRNPRCQRHFRHAAAVPQQGLHTFQFLPLKHRSRPRSRLRKKCFRPTIPQQLQIAFHGWQRHPEGIDDVHLPCRAHVNELTGKQPKAAQISFVMLEDGQRAIHIHHSLVLALDPYSIGDALGSRRENRQL